MIVRPMSFGEIIDGIFRSLRRSFWPLWWFLFFFNLPIEFLFLSGESVINRFPSYVGFGLLSLAIYLFFLFPIFQNVCTIVVSRQIKQEANKITLRVLLSNSFKQFSKLFIANGCLFMLLFVIGLLIVLPIGIPIYFFSPASQQLDLLAIVMMVGGMLWIFPASYFGIRLSLALPAITEEKLTVKQAFVRSWALTKRSYLLLFGKWMTLFGLQFPIIFLMLYLSDVFQNALFLLDFLLLLIGPIFIAFPHILLSLIYINQRAKKEGYDLTLLLAERGGSPLSQKLNKLESS